MFNLYIFHLIPLFQQYFLFHFNKGIRNLGIFFQEYNLMILTPIDLLEIRNPHEYFCLISADLFYVK
jgi:hypothetical protein